MRTNLSADANAGATNIKVRNLRGFAVGRRMTLGTPANKQTVTISAVVAPSPNGARVDFTPALGRAHITDETVIVLGTGLDLAAPLKFNHAANLPFSNRGTGNSFEPATAFTRSSDEPVQALGSGITLDRPLTRSHEINAEVRDAVVTTAGYQGTPAPNKWFGGPTLSTSAPFFNRTISIGAGSMVLRDSAGLVVDSLNYGSLWAAEGYQAPSGSAKSGCYVAAPGLARGFDRFFSVAASNTSAGRFPDGRDTDGNCADFRTSPSTTLAAASTVGSINIKVASVAGFGAGQTIRIDTGADLETAAIAKIGTAGASTLRAATGVGATIIPIASAIGFSNGQAVTIGSGANTETEVISSIRRFRADAITVASPLRHSHAAGAQVSGTGITLVAPLTREHPREAQITGSVSTPGAPNHYYRRPQ